MRMSNEIWVVTAERKAIQSFRLRLHSSLRQSGRRLRGGFMARLKPCPFWFVGLRRIRFEQGSESFYTPMHEWDTLMWSRVSYRWLWTVINHWETDRTHVDIFLTARQLPEKTEQPRRFR
jgi:hypothetical protein